MARNNNCQIAFERIKTYLLNPPILMHSVSNHSLLIYLAFHKTYVGCVLGQHGESSKKEHAIYYLNKNFADYKSRYCTSDMLCFAMGNAESASLYVVPHHIFGLPDDLLKYLFEKHALSGRLARWRLFLAYFDIIYVKNKLIKGQEIVDHLAENPINGYQPMTNLFPYESVLKKETERNIPIGRCILTEQ